MKTDHLMMFRESCNWYLLCK